MLVSCSLLAPSIGFNKYVCIAGLFVVLLLENASSEGEAEVVSELVLVLGRWVEFVGSVGFNGTDGVELLSIVDPVPASLLKAAIVLDVP